VKGESVANIPQMVLDEIRTKTIDQFAKYIDNAKSKKLLGSDTVIYDLLTELRKLRNRIHIQNTKAHFETDEIEAFNATRQSNAKNALETLLRCMEKNYSRTTDKKFVEDFILPWWPLYVQNNRCLLWVPPDLAPVLSSTAPDRDRADISGISSLTRP